MPLRSRSSQPNERTSPRQHAGGHASPDGAMRTVPFQPLDPALYREIVRRALAEDLGWGDVTTEATVPPDVRAKGIILAKSPCVVAGLDVAAEVFTQLDPGCTFE